MSADKYIRFTDGGNNILFRLPDGANIVLDFDDGIQQIMPCHYIDENHMLVGNASYSIDQFAASMEAANIRYSPEIPQALPKICYSTLPSTGQLIIITHGKSGYMKSTLSTSDRTKNESKAALLNANLDVTPQQEAAMLGGSMFGWATLAASVNSYDLHGQPIKPIADMPIANDTVAQEEKAETPAKVVIPCNVEITRYYRAYVSVSADATEEQIVQAMRKEILENQDDALTPDPDMGIEEDDIAMVSPDFDAMWIEEEDKENGQLLENIHESAKPNRKRDNHNER